MVKISFDAKILIVEGECFLRLPLKIGQLPEIVHFTGPLLVLRVCICLCLSLDLFIEDICFASPPYLPQKLHFLTQHGN